MAVHKSTTAPTTAPLSKNNKRRIILIIAPLTVLIISTLAFIFMPRSYPLDNQIEYLGKTDYGCILVCDSPPASVYYYGTDMSAHETIKHFKRANIIGNPNMGSDTLYLGLRALNGSTAYIIFHTDKSQVPQEISTTTKRYIFSTPSDSYPTLKSFL